MIDLADEQSVALKAIDELFFLGADEMKLLAIVSLGSVQLYELASLKDIDMSALALAGSGHVHDTALMTDGFRDVTTMLREGVEKLQDVETHPWYPKITFTECLLGLTAWYRKLDDERKRTAGAFFGTRWPHRTRTPWCSALDARVPAVRPCSQTT